MLIFYRADVKQNARNCLTETAMFSTSVSSFATCETENNVTFFVVKCRNFAERVAETKPMTHRNGFKENLN